MESYPINSSLLHTLPTSYIMRRDCPIVSMAYDINKPDAVINKFIYIDIILFV